MINIFALLLFLFANLVVTAPTTANGMVGKVGRSLQALEARQLLTADPLVDCCVGRYAYSSDIWNNGSSMKDTRV